MSRTAFCCEGCSFTEFLPGGEEEARSRGWISIKMDRITYGPSTFALYPQCTKRVVEAAQGKVEQ